MNSSPDASGKAQWDTLCDSLGKLDVLANGVKEGICGTRSGGGRGIWEGKGTGGECKAGWRDSGGGKEREGGFWEVGRPEGTRGRYGVGVVFFWRGEVCCSEVAGLPPNSLEPAADPGELT